MCPSIDRSIGRSVDLAEGPILLSSTSRDQTMCPSIDRSIDRSIARQTNRARAPIAASSTTPFNARVMASTTIDVPPTERPSRDANDIELKSPYVVKRDAAREDARASARANARANERGERDGQRAGDVGKGTHSNGGFGSRTNARAREGARGVCNAYARTGTCKYGDACKYAHEARGPEGTTQSELPGKCVFGDGTCAYGAACRYASTHNGGVSASTLDGTCALPRAATVEKELNGLSRELQHALRKKGTYDYTKADAVAALVMQSGRASGGTNEPTTSAAGETNDEGERATKRAKSFEEEDNATQNGAFTTMRPVEKKLIDFSNKLYLAPLTTVGNLPFRRVCKLQGADITCGEMAVVTQLLQGDSREWALLRRHKSEDIFGVQICGGYSDTIARCCQLLDENIEVDFIDINMGCPIDMVCKKGCGSAMLEKPKRMEQVVRAANLATTRPVTFKTRMSYSEKTRVAHTLAPNVADWGAAAMTLHGRTRAQRYRNAADWDYIKKVKEVCTVPLIGNGDVYTHADYYLHLEEHGVDTCMLARGALIKPWLFTEIKERRDWDISSGERFDILKQFSSFGLEHWGSDTRGVENTRRFLLEWMSFLYRYVPLGLIERGPVSLNMRAPAYVGRNDLETLLASSSSEDWMKISSMLLGPPPEGFSFQPKHKSNAHSESGAAIEDMNAEG